MSAEDTVPPPRRRWRRRIAATLLVLPVAALAVVHTPPVTRMVLRLLQDLAVSHGIQLRASSLSYNLLALSATLHDLDVTARTTPGEPFAAAAALTVRVGPRILIGRLDIREITLESPRLTIRRHADGGSNLPSFGGGREGAPPSDMRLPGITATGLEVVVIVPAATVSMQDARFEALPGAGDVLRLAFDVTGGLAVRTPDRTVDISGASARAALADGVLTIDAVTLERSGTSVRAAGTVDLGSPAYPIDLRVTGATELASWFGATTPARGDLDLEAHATGSLHAPVVDASIRGRSIAWGDLVAGRVGATAIWRNGVVTLSNAVADLAGGRVVASGAVDPDGSRASRLEVRWSEIDAAQLVPRAPAAGWVAANGTATVVWRTPTGGGVPEVDVSALSGLTAGGTTTPIRVGARGRGDHWHVAVTPGNAALLDMTATADVRVNREHPDASTVSGRIALRAFDLPSLLARLDDFGVNAGWLDTDTVRGAIDATVDIRGTLGAPQAAGRVTGRQMTSNGLPAANVDALFDVDVVRRRSRGSFSATVPDLSLGSAPAAAALTTRGRLEARGGWDGPLADPALEVSLVASDIRVAWQTGASAVVAGDGTVRLDLRGTFGAPDGRGHVAVGALDVAGRALGPLAADFVVANGRVGVAARAPQVHTRLDATVALDSPHVFDGDAELSEAALQDLIGLAGLPLEGLGGALNASARFSGTIASPLDSTVTLALQPTATVIRGVRVALDRGIDARLEDRRLTLRPVSLVLGGLTLNAQGEWSLDGGPGALTLDLDGEVDAVTPWLAAAGETGTWKPTGNVDGRIDVTGTPGHLTVTGTIAATLDQITRGNEVVASAVVVSAALDQEHLALREASASIYGGRLQLRGAAPLAWLNRWMPDGWRVGGNDPAPATLEASASFDLPAVMTAMGHTPGERLSGAATVTASLAASQPELEAVTGTLRADQLRVQTGDFAYAQHTPTTLEVRDGAVRIAALDWRGPGSTLTGSGQFGLIGSAPTQLRLDLDSQLGVLGALSAGRATGRISGFVELAGPPGGSVAVRLDAALADASWLLPAQRVLFSGWSGHLTLADDALVLEQVGGQVNGGRVGINGRLALDQPDDRGSVTLEARDVLLDVPKGLHSQASADLSWRLVGELPTIQGAVTITTSPYTEPVTRMLELVDSFAHGSGGGRTLPEVIAATNLAIDLHVTDPVVLDNSLGSVEMMPELRLTGTLDDPVVSGHIEVLNDGRIRLGGRTWRLNDSRITFAPAGDDLPTLDVVGETEISDYDVTIRITGTPQAIQTTYSSTPPLGQRELQSLVITGRIDTADSAGSGQQYAMDAATSDILGFAGKFVGLDSVRLGNADFDLMSSNASTAQHLTVSKDLGRQFEVILSDNLEDGTFSWILVYRPTTQTQVRMASIEEETSTIEFRQTLYFGPGVSSAASRAASPEPRRLVRAVTITGTPGFSEDEVRRHLKLQAGDRFDARAWIDDRLRLQAFYRDRGYHRVRIVPTRSDVEGGAEGTGVALAYAIERGPLTVIEPTGDGLPKSAVNEMYEAWRALPIADVAGPEFERIARESLARRGYFQPEIQVWFAAETPARAQAVVDVNRGPRTDTRTIAWSGNQAVGDAELNARVDAGSSGANVWSEPDSITWPIRQLYASRGYLEATVTPGEPTYRNGAMRMPVSIDEGPRARVASVTLAGADPARHDAALAALAVTEGSTFTNTLPGEATRRLEAFYRSLGFREVEVTQAVTPGEHDAMSIAWTVKEGPLSVVDAVSTTGVQSTSKHLVQDAVTLETGAPLGSGEIDETRRNLYNIGTFRRVDFTFGQKPLTAGNRRPVDVTIAAEEPQRFQFEYGLQLNGDRSFFGGGNVSFGVGGEIRDRNLFGHALQGSLGARWDPTLQAVGVLVAAPRLFGAPVRTNLYLRGEREVDTIESVDIEDDERDVTLDQRWRPVSSVELVWGYTLSRRRIVLKADDERVDIRGRLAGPNVSVVFDRRDSPFNATRGLFHSSNVQIGVEALGSELGYVRYLGRQSAYQTLGPLVVAGNVRWGLVRSYSGTVPLTALSLLFQTGGTNSVRGYEEDSLSARTILGVPIGGSELLVLNGEVRLPLSKWIGAAAFVDAGNTFGNGFKVASGNLGVGAGAGVRVNIPLAPLRFDFAWPLSDQFGQHGIRFHFSVGQMF